MGSQVLEETKRLEIWRAQPGPQTALLQCPFDEIFYGGAKFGGKSDGIIGKWIAHSNAWGQHAKGLIVRRTYPELEELEARAAEIFPHIDGVFSGGKRMWTFPNGSLLKFRHIQYDKDAKNFQGHSYSFIAADELPQFPSPQPINELKTCLRSAYGVTPIFLGTGNPGGPGHNWVKARYIDPAPPYTPIIDEVGLMRVFIPAKMDDNLIGVMNDPNYFKRIESSGLPDYLIKAWRDGNWDIVAGGYLDDVWRREVHVIKPFKVPDSWYIDRAFDWGSSKPYGYGLWAESDGTQAPNGRYYPPGTKFMIGELYGWNGQPNQGCRKLATEIAKEILEYEKAVGYEGRVNPGPADSSMWDCENGPSIYSDFEDAGVYFVHADKSPGSRKAGGERLRKLLKASMKKPMEDPGIFIFDICTHFIRTVPVLSRDIKKPDDVDTTQEDHMYDLTRYEIMGERHEVVQSGLEH